MNITEQYYINNAQSFFNNTFNANIVDIITDFTKNLQPNSKILDAGCGSGRDSLFFLNHGFQVVAFDSCKELTEIASKAINHPVLHLKFKDLTFENEFDAVWCMASLLHLDKKEFPHALQKCINAVKPNGLLFISLKKGFGTNVDDKNRFFSYYQEDELKTILQELNQTNYIFKINDDILGRNQQWINLTLIKEPPKLNLRNK